MIFKKARKLYADVRSIMNRGHKGAYCQHYTEMCYCTVLKLDLLDCPKHCPYFQVKDMNHTLSREILEECRFLQCDGVLVICSLRGDIISSCAGCKDFDSIDNFLPYPELAEYK